MTISIVGTGNVATHLGRRLMEQGVSVSQIIGRSEIKAAYLADALGATHATFSANIDPSVDALILAVSDAAIPSVGKQLSSVFQDTVVVHTSGTISSKALQPYFKHFGTLYPLQTFSLNAFPDFNKIPVFFNGSSIFDAAFIRQLAERISPTVYEIGDDDRMVLHLAGVFVNNFTNHLYKIAADIVQQKGLPFEVLLPLIEETVLKIKNNSPAQMQTGPARRGDNITIEKHLSYLTEHIPQYDLIYKILSININPDLTLNKP
jgi:predicted short-subunit dehydrogenase-like oxidoreductase (DUF2520 family)